MIFRFTALALWALIMTTVAGCGGGGGGGGSATGPSSTAPVTTPGATITSVTVNSPPVVTFVVNDSNGKPVSGLTLFNPAGAAGDPACGGSNVRFAIAKYDGFNWQNLVSRQRYAVDDFSNPSAPKYAVIEGATDPVPSATITNPPTAVNDPTARVVGILEQANGVYTYLFATDVTTPLLMANAIAGKNVALGKLANNGNLAVKDGQTIHRVTLQLCYVDPVTQTTVKVNPYMDFTLGADGKAVPFTDGQGNLVPAVQVVDRASCNECHQNLAHHNADIDATQSDVGAYVDPQACVMCHNPGSSDFSTDNPIDFKLMVHKFHMGKRLTQDFVVGTTVARQDLGAGNIAGILYPQDQRNCVECHDGSATAIHKTAQGDNWKRTPSKNACWACHDDYKTPASTWQTAHAPYASFFSPSISNPDATPDYVCEECHSDAGGGPAPTIAVSHQITEWVKSENYQYNIWGITKNPDNTVTVEYSVSNPNSGTDYDILNPQYQYTVVSTDGATTTKIFRFGSLNMLFGWNSTDYSNVGAAGRPWNSSCTIAPTASPSCDPTTGLPEPGPAGPIARGQPVAINTMFDSSVQRVGTSNHFKLTSTVLPAAANGTIAVAFQGFVNEDKDANTSWNIPVANVVKYFAMSGNEIDRRQVVSADACNACHGRNVAFTDINTFLPGLGGHDGSQTDPAVCVICHNGNLDGTSVLGGQADSGHFKRMIHMMHRAQSTNYPVMPSTLITTGDLAATGTYTGIINCNTCHVNGSYKTDLGVLGSSTIINTIDPSNPLLNSVISPKAATCSSCHVTDDAKNHMIQTGGAAFGTVTQTDISAGEVFESCSGCHQPGGIEPVDAAHGLGN
jgi:OmcA/MtrC family decaheme c-type cytochrome